MEKTQIEVINSFIDFTKSNEFISTIQKDFNNLKEVTNEIRSLNLKSTNEGEKELNRKKNRYRDILPYDESRVRLDLVKSDENNYQSGSDYINASFITNVLDGYYKYIAAQGPTKETIVDFIRMLVQFNIKIVLCACNEYEGQKLKCHRYWTDDQNEAFCIYKNYYVTLKSKPIVLDDCIIRQIKVIYNPSFMTQDFNSKSASNLENNNRSILEYEFTQFHLINWPDHGVPNNVESIINILGLVRKKMIENNKLVNENFCKFNSNHNEKNCKKIHFPLSNDFLVVHCSAGCGRTGTIIAIDQLWAMINETKLDQKFSLYEIAKALREQRIAMIQTQSQYLFFARATALLFEKYLKSLSNRAEKYQNNPVKSQISKVNVIQVENKTSVETSTVDLSSPVNRKYPIDSNNNIDYKIQNINKPMIKNEFTESSNLTPPKSPNARIKSANITKSPLTSVKQKINRLVPNMFQIFSPNSTPTITNYTQNYASNLHTPMSLSSVPSSPSPLSVSSNSSASSSASNAKNSVSKVIPRSNLAESYDNSPSLYIKHKTQSKISTPTSTISYNSKNNESTNFSSKSLFVYSDLTQERSTGNRARSASRLNSNGTPTLTSPKLVRKLSSTSERSSECDLSQQNSDNTELYLNDKSMSKKEPGSGCEFLTHKLNSNRQIKLDIHSNNNIPKSVINHQNEDAVPFSDGSISMLNFKHMVVNSAKVSSSKEIDLRQMNQPMKAEFYESLPLKPSDDQENKNSEESSEMPRPPARTKIQHKRFNMNESTRNAIFNMIETDFSNETSQSDKFERNVNQLPNKYVEIRVNKTSKSGSNLESYSDNFATRNYRNGILLDINSNSQKDFDPKENFQEHNKPAQSFYKYKSSKYDILTLPNKKYNQTDKNENKKSEDHDYSPFPFNSNLLQSTKNKLRQNSNYTFNKDLSINVQYGPNKSHYYYLINNLKNPLSSKFNNRKSLKIDQLNNDYYDNNFSASNENYSDNRNSLSKRRSTQVFDL